MVDLNMTKTAAPSFNAVRSGGETETPNDIELAEAIAREVAACGGRVYYVGGFVRDRLLGHDSKDVDIEVHGVTATQLEELLAQHGKVDSFGASFGIWNIRGHSLDIAMPRLESATGRGHRDFRVQTDPDLGTRKAAMRRDLTINALYEDVLTGEIVDHFAGRSDLEDGIIRHVNSESFAEDPLRVLRTAQFAARFDMAVDQSTIELCSSMDLEALSSERVEEELRKALLKAQKPSIFFEVLREMSQLVPWFREFLPLIGTPQNPKFHPEGDVWRHTMMVLDAAASLRGQADDAFAFMLAALCHDLGKPNTTQVVDGRIVSYGHERAGIPIAAAFLDRVVGSSKVKAYVLNMVELHMAPNMYVAQQAGRKAYFRLFDHSCNPEELLLLAKADNLGRGSGASDESTEALLEERLHEFQETMAQPFVQGRDLLEAGVEPGPAMGEVLRYAHKLRLAGVPKNEALRQCLGHYRKLTRITTPEVLDSE